MKKLHGMSQRKHSRQAGFTMLEMMIVMVIISVLAGIGVSLIDKQSTNAKVTDARAFVERTFVMGLKSCQMKYRSYSSCTHTAGSTSSNLAKEGLEIKTPWETNWSSSAPSGSILTLTYPLGAGNEDAASDLQVSLSNSKLKHIDSATVSGSSVTVKIKVS